jgi:hypothetical protein
VPADAFEKLFLYVVLFLQFGCFAHTAVSRALAYFRYTHPRATLLDVEVLHPIPRTVYSTRGHAVTTAWTHADVAIITVVLVSGHLLGNVIAGYVSMLGAIASVGLTVPATKYVLQFRLIELLLPCFRMGSAGKAAIQRAIAPIRSIAFRITASAAKQALLLPRKLPVAQDRADDLRCARKARCATLGDGSVNATAERFRKDQRTVRLTVHVR